MPTNLRNIDLNLLTVFDALSEEEHLTRAAERLHLSQPAVSNALSRLRELFNDDLFVRASKGMRPTLKAKSLRDPIKQALAIIESQLAPDSSFDSKTAAVAFSISVNGYAEFMLLPPLIAQFRKTAPNITLNVYPESNTHTSELLRSGELDIAIDYLSIGGKDFKEIVVFEEELVVVAAEDNSALHNGITTKLYNSLPHVSIHPRGHKGSHTEILLGRKRINRNVVMTVCNLISFPPLVAGSDLICTLPRRLANHFQNLLPLKIHELPFSMEKIPVYLTYHKDRENDSANIWLREQISNLSNVDIPPLVNHQN